VRDVGIPSGREPEVHRAEGTRILRLTFRGTSRARSSVDRDTHIRIAISAGQAARLWYLWASHLSDQYGPYHSTTISATASEAPYLVHGLLYHETDLEIVEHYSDTGAFTDQIFGICQLLGFRHAPRIRDLADKRLHPFEKASSYPAREPLIGDRINVGQLESQWEELLRLATSIRQGTVTASLVLRKLAPYPRQNGLAWGLRELGRIDRTLFMLEWLQNPELRRRVTIGLNKGEAKNALSRAACFHRRGMVHDRTFDDQRLRAGGLNLVVAAIVYWNTVYLEQAVAKLSAAGL
jgi:TnpA family transposase